MLAVHDRGSNGPNEYKRRPTRFSASFEPLQSTLSSSHQDAQTKSKCSTITRVSAVPSKTSRLRPPVANLSSGIVNESASHIARTQPSRLRPTSLALKSREISLSSNSRVVGGSASVLPRISSSHTNIRSSQESSIQTKSKITIIRDDGGLKSSSCLNSRQIVRRQDANIKQSSVTQSSSSEWRLSGSKNLVAVVHPQHITRRVNQNLASSKVNKLTITKKSTTITACKGKIESGKVGSPYHKQDAPYGDGGRSSKASKGQDRQAYRDRKQDGGQIVARHSSTKTTMSTTLNAALTNSSTTTSPKRQMTSPPHYSSCCSSSSCSPTTTTATTSEAEDKSDQFTLGSSNNNNNDNDNPTNYLLSVASNNGDLHEDKKLQQHGNNKQSNKHLSAHTYPPVTSPLDQQQTSGRSISLTNANDNDCYNKNKHHDAKSANATKPQTTTSYSSRRNSNNTAPDTTHAINNNHLLPKPMGQQVLSLMMLDVGLLPANAGNNNNQYHYQQQILSPKRRRRSHVRLQSPTREDISGRCGINSHLLGNGELFTNHDRNSIDKLSNSIDFNDHEPSNDFHSWQPSLIATTAPAHEMLRLQVRLSKHDKEKLRSISLPSSPRIGFLDCLNHSNHTRDGIPANSKGLNFLKQGNPLHQAPHRSGHDNFCTKVTSSLNIEPTHASQQPLSLLNEHLISICDNQDSNSLTSSSCSSLNQYPPLLALSNQLNILKFEELVRKANIGSNHKTVKGSKQQNSHSIEAGNIRIPTFKRQDSTAYSTKTTTSLSSDQVSRIAKQHEQQHAVIDDSDPKIQNHQSNKKIDHVEECSEQIEGFKFPTSDEGYPREQPIKSTVSNNSYHTNNQFSNSQVRPNELVHNNESCGYYQSRRQQQSRSHSISGQEFHSNGGYQRLKHSLYNQQQQQGGAFDGYQNYGAQSSSRLQQPSSPYQQQLVGRSPSPLSINCQTHYGSPLRDGSIKQYPLDLSACRQPRNQLHASLECLNTTYSDYHHVQRLQEQQQQLLHHQQQQIHNQHYAANYVLAAPPVNTVINSNGDQDLAAAAMGTPPSHCNPAGHNNTGGGLSSHLNIGSYNHQTQNLINRAMAQVSQSPLRRLGLGGNPQGPSPGLLSHVSNHHPMRAGHSSLSLASSSFIIEDKLQNEIRKLQSELKSEKEKNEALNSQLNINSSLMAAFEQSLTTLNTRLRQLTTLNEKKDNEIEELKEQLRSSKTSSDLNKLNGSTSPKDEIQQTDDDNEDWAGNSEISNNSERSMMIKTIEDLKRQLIEKDRLLTDTRLEALSAAHQLEQLESKLNGEHNSILINEDELDEGVMVVNHSPSDSDAITDSAHFSEINSQISKSNQHCSNGDNISFNTNTPNISSNNNNNGRNFIYSNIDQNNCTDDHHSNHSNDYQTQREVKERDQQRTLTSSVSQQFNETDSGVMCKLMDNLLLTN